MATIGAPRLRQRPFQAVCLPPILVLSHMGPRKFARPTQALQCMALNGRLVCPRQARRRIPTRGRQLAVRAVAMVNVDFASPSLLLGTALIGCGVLLLNLRNFQNKVSRDADIVVAAMVSIVGSTLIFQGWRLDPLLLLCQALTTSVAFWYGLETFRLRSKEADMAPPPLLPGPGADPSSLDAAQQQYYYQQQQQQQPGAGGYPPPPPGSSFLPPGADSYYPWRGDGTSEASVSGQAGVGGLYGSSGGSAAGGPGGNPYAETIQYDYYGNPVLPQQSQQEQQPLYDSSGYDASTSYGSASPYGMPPVGDNGSLMYGQQLSDAAPGGPAAGTMGQYPGGEPYSNSVGPGPASPSGLWDATASSSSSNSGSTSEAYGGLGQYGNAWQYGSGAAAEAGSVGGVYGAGAAPASPPWGNAGGQSPGQSGLAGPGAGSANGVGRGGVAGRLDLHEEVDDWE